MYTEASATQELVVEVVASLGEELEALTLYPNPARSFINMNNNSTGT